MTYCSYLECEHLNCIRNAKEQYRLAKAPYQVEDRWRNGCEVYINREKIGELDESK